MPRYYTVDEVMQRAALMYRLGSSPDDPEWSTLTMMEKELYILGTVLRYCHVRLKEAPGRGRNPFDKLPPEIIMHIALELHADADLYNFLPVCRSIRDAIGYSQLSFWRRRFATFYDHPQIGLLYKDAHIYQLVCGQRRDLLKHDKNFLAGTSVSERVSLELLRDIVVESFGESTEQNATGYSKNLEFLKTFAKESNILCRILVLDANLQATHRGPGHPLMNLMQIILAPVVLRRARELAGSDYGFGISQKVVYTAPKNVPILVGTEIHLGWLLHQLNFWKHHIGSKTENTLRTRFEELDAAEQPSLWKKALSQDRASRTLGRHWRGTYAYVERNEMANMRSRNATDIQDKFAGENCGYALQELVWEELRDEEVTWPLGFGAHFSPVGLPSSRRRTRNRARFAGPSDGATEALHAVNLGPIGFQLTGDGVDRDAGFLADGWLAALPPQYGVPGWQHLTMMKWVRNENTGRPTMKSDELWAYEGVVLPGGQVIFGRWWCPVDGTGSTSYSGPFMMWCV